MNVWAIVPVKPLNRAKSRLAGVLAPEVREQLATAMLTRTVSLLAESPDISGTLVISRDSRALVIARRYGAKTVQESGNPELNPSLERASQVIASWNAGAALVLPADLPLLALADLKELVNLGRYNQSAVIVPDRLGDGTNGLLLRPPGLISFSFGPHSFARHLASARAANATVHVYRSERLTLDLDVPEDLLIYLELCPKYHVEPLIEFDVADLLPFVTAQEEKT